MWEVNENGVYTYAGSRVRDLLGYEAEEVLGKKPFDFMPPDGAQRLARVLGEIIAKSEAITCIKNTNIHKNGRLVVLKSSGIPFFGPDGEYRGYCGVSWLFRPRSGPSPGVRR